MGFGKFCVFGALVAMSAYASGVQSGYGSCPQSLTEQDLAFYRHFTVTDSDGIELWGTVNLVSNGLYFYPELAEPLTLARGNPPTFAKEISVDTMNRRLVFIKR